MTDFVLYCKGNCVYLQAENTLFRRGECVNELSIIQIID